MPKQPFTRHDLAALQEEINEHSVYELRLVNNNQEPFTTFGAFVVADIDPITKGDKLACVRDTPQQGIAQEIARNHLVDLGFETHHVESHVWDREV
jgi:hypothetical protein